LKLGIELFEIPLRAFWLAIFVLRFILIVMIDEFALVVFVNAEIGQVDILVVYFFRVQTVQFCCKTHKSVIVNVDFQRAV